MGPAHFICELRSVFGYSSFPGLLLSSDCTTSRTLQTVLVGLVGFGSEIVLPTVPGHTTIILEFPPGHYPIPTKHLQFASHGKTSGDGEVEEGGGDFQLSGNLQLTCPCRGPSYPSLAKYREFSFFQATQHSSG